MNSMYMKKKIPRKADGRIDFTPRKHHGYTFLIVVLGFLLPPLAVAARFGFGKDFFINCFLTLCGYIPGHGHNFFLQNIRNNENRGRTPKWAKRYGLVDDTEAKELAKKREWTGRYNDQTHNRQMYDDDGNVYEYDYDHRFEDGDGPSRPRQRAQASDDRFFGDENGHANGRAGSGSGSSLRSRASLSSLRRRPANSSEYGNGNGDYDLAPGAGDAERRRAKSKGKTRGLLGRHGRSKSDRHARAEQVMAGDDYNHRNVYDDPSVESVDGVDGTGGGGRHRSNGMPPTTRQRSGLSDDLDGPEDADTNIGRRYVEAQKTGSAGYTSSSRSNGYPPPPPAQVGLPKPPAKDIMEDNHQF